MSEDTHQVKRARKSNDIPAVLRINIDKATSLLNKRKSAAVLETNGQDDPSLQCLLDYGMRQNGYPSVSWSHTEANIQVSHLALRVDKGDAEVPYRCKRETASHLCHNKLCIKADHIIKETVGANSRRNGCLAFVTCGCGCKVNACGHTPRCLLPFPKNQPAEAEE